MYVETTLRCSRSIPAIPEKLCFYVKLHRKHCKTSDANLLGRIAWANNGRSLSSPRGCGKPRAAPGKPRPHGASQLDLEQMPHASAAV